MQLLRKSKLYNLYVYNYISCVTLCQGVLRNNFECFCGTKTSAPATTSGTSAYSAASADNAAAVVSLDTLKMIYDISKPISQAFWG